MISKYRAGLTPNPDILCNKFIKFGSLRNYIDLFFGCDHFIATGHYADVNLNGSQSAATLAIPLDKVKDQTFFLSQVSQNALQKTLFPLANIVKKDVKKIARESTLGFVNEKKESMGLCFVGERKFNEFLKDYIPIRKGQVVDFETGQFMGEHEGVQFYTSGQSLLLQYVQKCRTEFFVYNRDSIENILYVVKGRMNPLLWRSECKLRNFHWISGKLPDELRKKVVMTCQCRMQHGWPLINCDISIEHGLNPFDLEDTEEFTIKVKVHGRCWAVTPGQFCVLYEDEVCLGSGEILPFENDEHEMWSLVDLLVLSCCSALDQGVFEVYDYSFSILECELTMLSLARTKNRNYSSQWMSVNKSLHISWIIFFCWCFAIDKYNWI